MESWDKTLEKLLNELISMGWKPWGWKTDRLQFWDAWLLVGTDTSLRFYSLNDLCSIDSWLRQFVCDYKWIYENDEILVIGKWFVSNHYSAEHNIEYRLMLSSIQEDKEKFLLDNIKI